MKLNCGRSVFECCSDGIRRFDLAKYVHEY